MNRVHVISLNDAVMLTFWQLAISEGVFIQSLLLVKERFAPYKDIITKGLKESLDYLNVWRAQALNILQRIEKVLTK